MRFNDVGMKAILMAGVLFLLLLLPLFVFEAAASEDGRAQELVREVSQEKWAAGANAVLRQAQGPLTVTAIGPSANEVGVALSAPITVTFDDDLDASTVTSSTFVVHGQMSGLMTGTYSYDGPSKTLRFDPQEPFKAGEAIAVTLNNGIQATDGTPFTGYQWQFTAGLTTARCVAGFSDISANLTGVHIGSVAWGDYDKDGDLDILLTGHNGSGVAKVYRNDNGTFNEISTSLTGVYWSSAAWGDYDNDGDLDILLTGHTGSTRVAKVYRNDNGAFNEISTNLTGVYVSSVAWGDYDNDGDLDILLTGQDNNNAAVAKVYRNDNGTFNDISANLTGVWHSSVAWGDYDNDGDLDILLTGYTGSTRVAKVYRNDNGAFTDISANLRGVYVSSVAWGDYDNDGDLDILLTGQDNSGTRVAKVYRNDNSIFNEISTNLTGVWYSSVAWGDYDNDGDLDILLTGRNNNNNTGVAKVYRNDNGTFNEISALSANLTDVWYSSVAWGDYDLDGDLDILLTGYNGAYVAKVYKNEACSIITLPGGALDYTENASATIIDSGATVSDDDSPDFDTGTLTVDYEANGTADDRLQIRNQGTGAGQIGVTNDTITFGGTQIATFTGGSGTTPLVITFNSDSSPASAQALVRNLTYHNVSDAPSTTSRTLRMVLNDGDGSTSQPATKTINLTALNDAPILDNSGDPTLSAIDEDVASASNNGTLVSAIIASGAGGNPISDPDSGAVEGLAVTAVDNSNGTWQFDAAGGTNWSAFNAPADDSATLLAPSATIRFVPNANFNDTASITWSAWDQTSGNNGDTAVDTSSNGGTTAFSSATESATITVNPLNDPPTGADESVTTPEDQNKSFSGADFTFNDVDGHTFNGIRIESVETAGDLEENGGDVSVSQIIEDVTTLVFKPAANANGTAYATFTFKVRDSSGEWSANDYTMTINVTAVNDAPTGGDESVTTTEDQNKSFSESDFASFDDVDEHTFNGIRIESVETAGDLEENGSDVSAGEVIEDVTNLVFIPAANANGSPYATFTFKVRDSSGEFSANDYTMTINVTAVNDAPTGANGSVTTPEDAAYTFDGNEITFDDVDGHSFNAIRIESLETAGDLEENGSDVSVGEIIEDVTNLVFKPAANANGTPYATFTFKVRDSSGALSADDYTMTINVTAVNDTPTGANESVTTPEDQNKSFEGSDFTFNDVDGHTFNGIRIETIETAGDLEENGSDVTVGEVIEDVTNLVFTPAANANGTPYATFTFKVRDSSGALSADVYTMTINVTAVNDAPTVNDRTFDVDENPPLGSPVGSVVASDPDEGDSQTYAITAGNTDGDLRINAQTGEISVNKPLDFERTSVYNLTVVVTDDDGLSDSASVTIEVNDINEAPTSVSISGPEKGDIDTDYSFTATVVPQSAELPITYTWEATGQAPIIHTTNSLNDSVMWNWQINGLKTITVTAANNSGSVTGSRQIPIGNLPPEARNVTINEVALDGKLELWVVPTAGAAITVSYEYDDPDGNASTEQGTLIRWARGGQFELQGQPKFNEQRSIPSGITIAEERWCVTVTPHDGQDAGEPIELCAYIQNVPHLLPTAEGTIREELTSSEPLTFTYTYNPPAAGNRGQVRGEGEGQVRLYRDGTLQAKFNNLDVIPPQETNPGEVWCGVVQPYDGQAFGPISPPKCTIISPPEGFLPQINAEIRSDEPSDDENLTIHTWPIGSADSRDQESAQLACDENTLHIRWFRKGQAQPNLNNSCTVSSDLTQPGDKWWATVLPHNQFGNGRLVLTKPVYILASETETDTEVLNTPPVAREVKITPAQPEEDERLFLTYTYFDADGDPEGDTLIRWYKDLQYVSDYDGMTLIPSDETSPGEVWYAVVTPNDGKVDGEQVAADSVVIGGSNTRPEVLIVYLSPGLPGDDEPLKLRYRYYDEDGDLEGDSQVSWTVNGQARPAYNKQTVIPETVTMVGDQWCAIVTPHDGLAPGEAKLSNCVTIQQNPENSAPEARDAHIAPAPPTSSDDLELEYTYFDADGDAENKTIIYWYRNKRLQREFDNQTLVPASETAPGDVWYAVISVHDGTEYSKQKATAPIVTINKAPQMTEAYLSPSPATQDQDLILEDDYTDEDRDPDNSKILWYKDGSYQPEYNNRQTIPHQALAAGQVWYAVVTASDGYEETDVITTTEVTIWCAERLLSCTYYLPLLSDAPEALPTATPTPTPSASPTPTFTPTPTPTPTSTPTPPIGEEENDTQQTAQGPLVSAQEYNAYPDDEDDWYYFIMSETGPAEIEVRNYRADGQVIVYEEYFDRNHSPQRETIANDGRGRATMEIPNEIDPHVLSNLSPGKYLVRIYTVAGYQQEQQYRLKARYGFK